MFCFVLWGFSLTCIPKTQILRVKIESNVCSRLATHLSPSYSGLWCNWKVSLKWMLALDSQTHGHRLGQQAGCLTWELRPVPLKSASQTRWWWKILESLSHGTSVMVNVDLESSKGLAPGPVCKELFQMMLIKMGRPCLWNVCSTAPWAGVLEWVNKQGPSMRLYLLSGNRSHVTSCPMLPPPSFPHHDDVLNPQAMSQNKNFLP